MIIFARIIWRSKIETSALFAGFMTGASLFSVDEPQVWQSIKLKKVCKVQKNLENVKNIQNVLNVIHPRRHESAPII